MPQNKQETVFHKRFNEISQFESQKIAAEKLYMDPKKLNRLLKGTQEPKETDIELICKTYNCSADYLLGLKDVYSSDVTYKDLVLSLWPLLVNKTLAFDDKGNIIIQDPLLKYLISSMAKLHHTKVLSETELKSIITDIIVHFNYPILKNSASIKAPDQKNKILNIDIYNEFQKYINESLDKGIGEREAYIKAAKDFCAGDIKEYIDSESV